MPESAFVSKKSSVKVKQFLPFLICWLFYSCEKEPQPDTISAADFPLVSTSDAVSILSQSATVGGKIELPSTSPIQFVGICWSSSITTPTKNESKTEKKFNNNIFSASIGGLLPGTKYWFRAYAVNKFGTTYGRAKCFTTISSTNPVITTDFAQSSSSTSIRAYGTVVSNGNSNILSQGFCWSRSNTQPDIINSEKTTSSVVQTGSFNALINNLSPDTDYFVRAFATNANGTTYGNVLKVRTNMLALPTVRLASVTTTSAVSAIANGEIIASGDTPITTYGFCWSSLTSSPSISNSRTINSGDKKGTFSELISALQQGTVYYVRAYATNSAGTAYSSTLSFTTSQPDLPTVASVSVINVTATTAIANGRIDNNGNNPIISSGFCWSTATIYPTTSDAKTTTNGNFLGSFQANINLLIPDKIYHLRAYATSNQGTAYGASISFRTLSNATLPTVSTNRVYNSTNNSFDAEGNISSNGNSNITSYGFCYSYTNSSPTTSNSKTTNTGSLSGTFNNTISGLLPGTKYYIRAYATNSVGTSYGSTLSFTTAQNYIVGNTGPGGGIIFYDKGDYLDGWRYLEVTNQDLGIYSWGCPTTFVNGLSPALGTGKSNTSKILINCSLSNIAASICENLSQNGYSDWFLPSYYEMDLIYQKIIKTGLASFSSTNYWTSTQFSTDSAYTINFSTYKFSQVTKNTYLKVRAIRSF